MYNLWRTLIVLSLATVTLGKSCTNPVLRKEFRNLSPEESSRFLKAVQKLHSEKYEGQNYSKYEHFTRVHAKHNSEIHNNPSFLPWHRRFIRDMEKELQRIDSQVILPYWDWSLDSQAPHKSSIFTSDAFGGNGQGRDNCVRDGPFSNWTVTYPSPHCLRRDFNNGQTLSAYPVPEAIVLDLNEPRFSDFSQQIEYKHAHPHISIGGKKGDFHLMHSPNDPIFYLHHGFIDKLWFEWQKRNPSSDYDGTRYNRRSRKSDKLNPFQITVDDTWSTLSEDYCYTYDAYPQVPKLEPEEPELSPTPELTPDESTDNQLEVNQPEPQPEPVPQPRPRPTPRPSSNSKSKLFDWFNKANPFVGGPFRKATLSQVLNNNNFRPPAMPAQLASSSPSQDKITPPPPIPDEFIKMNGWNPSDVKKNDQSSSRLVNFFNSRKLISLAQKPKEKQPSRFQLPQFRPSQFQPSQFQPSQFRPSQFQPSQLRNSQFQPSQFLDLFKRQNSS